MTWLTKRLGAPVSAPSLSALGYELVGGRLLPGGAGPVALFMYGAPDGQRLTLYVTREAAGGQTAFQFTQEGPVRVFYWAEARSATRCRAPSAGKNCNGCRWKSTDSCRADIAPRVARGAVSGRRAEAPAWTGPSRRAPRAACAA